MKIIKYFLEAILVYFLFFLIKIIGLNLARKIISNLFLIFGPLIRSDKIIKKIYQLFSVKKMKMK